MSNYLKNKIFSYRDLSTGVYLDLSIDSSFSGIGNWVNFNPIQLCFSIYDSRVNEKMSKVSLCLRYQNVLKLINNIRLVNSETVFDTGCNISIPQYTNKCKKELTLNFGLNNQHEKIVQVSLMDNLSQVGRAVVSVDKESFSAIVSILNDFSKNLLKIDIATKQLFMNYKTLEQLSEIKDKPNIQYHDASKHRPEDDTTADSDVDLNINEYNEEPTEPSAVQKDFMNVCEKSDMFSNVDIGINSKDILLNKREELIKCDKPFIGTFLNYDLTKLKTWVTSFVCLTEKSDYLSFVPFDIIMNLGKIKPSEREIYQSEFGYYPMQYASLHILKNAVKQAIFTGEYPKNVPAIRFNSAIKKGTPLHKLSQEILVVFLMCSFINNNYINMEKVDIEKLDNFKRSYFAIKLLFSPFIFSMETYDDFIDDLVHVFDLCVESGLLKSIEKEYCEIACGGKIAFNKEMFEKYCNSFLNVMKRSNIDKFNTEEETKKTFNKYKVSILEMEINNGQDIKSALFGGFHDSPPPLEENKIEDKPKEEVEPKSQDIDPRYELFFECSKGYIDDDILKKIKESCKKIDDLKACFLKYDIPAELFKIMRAIQIDVNAKTKRQVLVTAKLFKEDESVTASSGLQEDVPTTDPTDIQSFLASTDVF